MVVGFQRLSDGGAWYKIYTVIRMPLPVEIYVSSVLERTKSKEEFASRQAERGRKRKRGCCPHNKPREETGSSFVSFASFTPNILSLYIRCSLLYLRNFKTMYVANFCVFSRERFTTFRYIPQYSVYVEFYGTDAWWRLSLEFVSFVSC